MKFKNNDMDMLNGALTKKLLLFTLPIALSSIVQQLFNAADTSVAGYFGNPNALAAVGTNAEIVALIVTLSSGLSVGANIIIANRIGKNERRSVPAVTETAVILALIIGVIGFFIGQAAARPLLMLIQTPNEILDYAQQYLRIYLFGYPFLLLYDFGAAVLRAKGDSRYPFSVLALSGIVNVLLNLLFVAVLKLDVAGVAAATCISTALSAFLVLLRLKRSGDFLSHGRLSIKGEYIFEILKTGVPSAVQGAVFCFANIFVQTAVNKFGARAIAGSTIAVNFEYFAYYIITAFAQTATTFTGQNSAAGKRERCKKILWLCLLYSVISSLFAIVPVVVFKDFFAGLFSKDGAAIGFACMRIMCILLFEPICSLYEIPAGVLRGTGYAVLPALSTVLGTCVFRIVWIFTVFNTHKSLETLYLAFPLSWVLTIILVLLSFLFVRIRASSE